MRFSLNVYFFVLLDVFFAVFLAAFAVFFAFFAFLAMFPSVNFKNLAQCKSTFDMHTLRIHHNRKIDTACFEEGKRPPHRRALRAGETLASCVETAICRTRRKGDVSRSRKT
jgi:hypothetical protein